ncbi:MAG TPA: 30S ribosomal protein S11 [Candidatus Paceibacterota bacterium]
MGKKRVIQKGEEGVEETQPAAGGTARKVAKKGTKAKKIAEGRVYVLCSYNNTLMTLTDGEGNVIANTSAGAFVFKGTKKATPFAASKVAEKIADIAQSKSMEKLAVVLRGVGSGRDSALRSIGGKGFDIISIVDNTPVPHNGPRARKIRRV